MKIQQYKEVFLMGLCVICLFGLTGCSSNNGIKDGDTGVEKIDYNQIYTLSEADTTIAAEHFTEIVFEDEQEVYLIENPGTYLLKGEHEGQIQIDAQDQIVHLILEDVNLKSYNGPAVYVKSAAKAVITVPEDSNCILMDSAYYANYADAKGCIYSASDLTVNGSGTLQVYGYYKDAIRSKDVLKILGIDLAVKAKDNGLRGNDGVVIQTEALKVECEGTGIYTEKEKKTNQGFVDMASGTVQIIAGEYGIRASENIYIHDCKVDMEGIIQDIICSGKQYIEEGCLE